MSAEFAAVLASAIARRRATLDELSRELRRLGTPVSVASLSYWQTGRSQPARPRSMAAVRNLEQLLGLVPDQLVDLLPQAEAAPPWDPHTVVSPQHRFRSALAAIGMDLSRRVVNLSLQDSVTVSQDGMAHRQVTRQLVRAVRDEVHSIPLAFDQYLPGASAPGVAAGRGCRIANMLVLEQERMVVAELALPRPIVRGELSMVEYHTLWEAVQEPETQVRRVLTYPAQFYVSEVAFTGGYQPQRAWRVSGSSADTPDPELARQVLPVGPHLQLALTNAPAGVHGIDWYGPR